MKIEFSDHAKDHLKEERTWVSKEQVREVVENPEQKFQEESNPNRHVVHKKVELKEKEYLLRVFFEEQDNESLIVVSFYYTSKMDKYWRESL